jgi:hypothetical protein
MATATIFVETAKRSFGRPKILVTVDKPMTYADRQAALKAQIDANLKKQYVQTPLMVAGTQEAWMQLCFVCGKWCEIKKWADLPNKPFISIGHLRRHTKCSPVA